MSDAQGRFSALTDARDISIPIRVSELGITLDRANLPPDIKEVCIRRVEEAIKIAKSFVILVKHHDTIYRTTALGYAEMLREISAPSTEETYDPLKHCAIMVGTITADITHMSMESAESALDSLPLTQN